MKTALTSVLAILATCVVMTVCSTQSRSQEPDRAQNVRLRSLQTERRDTLRELLDVITNSYHQGLTDIDELFRIRTAVLEAELPLAGTNQERLTLLQQQVDNLREFEDVAMKRHGGGQTPLNAVLTARAARLAAEIRLEQVRLQRD